MADVPQALRDATPKLLHLTRLEMHGCRSHDDTLATSLPPLTSRLLCLRLPQCGLFREPSIPHVCHASSWLGLLSTLPAVEDLDLSRNRISRKYAGKLVAVVSHLPLRRLAHTDCGLEAVSALAQMHTEQGEDPSRPLISLRELDLSCNAMDTVPKAGSPQPLLGQLTVLGMEFLICHSREGVRSLLREVQGRGADMRESRFGMGRQVVGVAALVQRCLVTWPQLRVLNVCWPAGVPYRSGTLESKDMPVHVAGLQELRLQHVRSQEPEPSVPQRLPLLTKMVIFDVEYSLNGERALGGGDAFLTGSAD